MIFRLWREVTYLDARERLPHISRALRNPFNPCVLSDDEQLVMLTGRAGDPDSIRRLLHRAGILDGLTYVQHNRPQRPRVDKRQRLLNWLRRIEGSTPTERVLSDYLKQQREKPRERGLKEIKLKTWR